MLSRWLPRLALLVCLVSTVFVAAMLGMIDNIVHQDLYHYGLRFSYDWANSYWFLLRSIYVCLAVSAFLSVAALAFNLRKSKAAQVNVPREVEAKPEAKTVPLRESNMVISCPKCRRVFSRPLVMLDFGGGKTRLMNVCPYCNHVLGSTNEQEEFVDLDSAKVKPKQG